MKGLTIRAKMLVVFSLFFFNLVIVAVISLHGIGQLSDDMADMYRERLVPVSQLARIDDLMHSSIEQITIAVIARPGPSDVRRYTDRVEKNLVEIQSLYKNYAKHVLGEKDKKLLAQWTALRDKLISKGIEPAISALKSQKFDDAEDIVLGVALRQFAKVKELFDTIIASKGESAQQAETNAEYRNRITHILVIGAGIFAFGLSVIMAFYVGRAITKPLATLTDAMRRLADGDIDVILPGLGRKDEIGQIAAAVEGIKVGAADKARHDADKIAARQAHEAEEAAEQRRLASERQAQAAAEQQKESQELLRAKIEAEAAAERQRAADEQTRVLSLLAAGLKSLSEGDLTMVLNEGFSGEYQQIKDDFNTAVARLKETISAIAGSAREVSSATAEISVSTNDLSQRTEEQAASLEETSASMEEIASVVKKNAENAHQANQSAIATSDIADRSGQVVAQAVDAMARIEESSGHISDIIGVIDEIARQTNLLALNAAVEAARAGEAGRGFAVVATEVRGLAQRSSQAAKDIKDLITNSNGQVKEGVDLVSKAGTALHEIVDSIKSVTDLVAEIASASQEQSTGIEQINRTLTQMDEMTQQNSALVEENAATAKTLEHQASAMDEHVAYFRLNKTQKMAQSVAA